jgi:hypothetical protein
MGYLDGNDLPSCGIVGEDPLYLPPARVYTGSCAVGFAAGVVLPAGRQSSRPRAPSAAVTPGDHRNGRAG